MIVDGEGARQIFTEREVARMDWKLNLPKDVSRSFAVNALNREFGCNIKENDITIEPSAMTNANLPYRYLVIPLTKFLQGSERQRETGGMAGGIS